MSPKARQVHELFSQFIDVCNKAMEVHKDEFPYKHIWEAAEELQPGAGMHVTIYDDEPKGDYQLKIVDKHIDVMDEDGVAPDAGWRINTSYMKQVLANPEEYINEPTKLDWQWLKNRG